MKFGVGLGNAGKSMLFPTRHKSKISSKLSYAAGAELISAELANVPQAPSFDITFYSGHNYFLENRGDPYPILNRLVSRNQRRFPI